MEQHIYHEPLNVIRHFFVSVTIACNCCSAIILKVTLCEHYINQSSVNTAGLCAPLIELKTVSLTDY